MSSETRAWERERAAAVVAIGAAVRAARAKLPAPHADCADDLARDPGELLGLGEVRHVLGSRALRKIECQPIISREQIDEELTRTVIRYVELSLAYEFPAGWISERAASFEIIRAFRIRLNDAIRGQSKIAIDLRELAPGCKIYSGYLEHLERVEESSGSEERLVLRITDL